VVTSKGEFPTFTPGAWKPAYDAGSHISTATTAAGLLSAMNMNPAKIAGLVRFLHRTIFTLVVLFMLRSFSVAIQQAAHYEEVYIVPVMLSVSALS